MLVSIWWESGGNKRRQWGGDQQKFHMHELVKYMNLKHALDSGYII